MTEESPFRFLNSILTGREPIIETEDDEKEYKKVAFLTNRGLSQHVDTIMYANEMNQMPHLSPKMQYDYLFKSIRKTKRPFNKWAKGSKNEDVVLVQRAYGYSEKKAKEVLQYWPNIKSIIGDKEC